MGNSSVAFVICARNNRSIIGACLDSVRAQRDAGIECIVVDDASTDGTAEWIESAHPWVTVIRNPVGLGPSRGRNLATKRTDADYVAFLDSDVVLDPIWLSETAAVLDRDERVGMVGGKLLFASQPDVVNAYGGVLGRIGLGWNGHEGEPHESLTEPIECLWVCSAALLTRRSLMEELGGFDESFFYGYEDSDLGWGACLMGHRVLCIPSAIAYHRVNETVEKMGDHIVFHYAKNRLRSMLKNYGIGRLARFLPLYLLYALADAAMRPPRRGKFAALWWNAGNLRDTLRRRTEIQGKRRVNDAKLGRMFCRGYFPPTTLAYRQSRLAWGKKLEGQGSKVGRSKV